MKYMIDGTPIPLARPRHYRNTVYDTQKRLKDGIRLILITQHQNRPLLSGSLAINIIFAFEPPQSLSKKKKLALIGQPHNKKPDIDNCIKFLFDVCNGLIFKDDCQIAQIYAKKIYDTNAKTEFYVEETSQNPQS